MGRLALIATLLLSVALMADRPASGRSLYPNKAVTRIVVSQDDQAMYVYEGERLARTLPVSTGWPGLRKTSTPVWSGRVGRYWGTFSSFGTTQDNGYYLFTDYLDDDTWNGDVLVHGAPYQVGPAGTKVYDTGGIGKTPVSNGCIRILPEDAEWFADWDPVGVPITILPFSHGTLAYPKLGVGAQLVAATQTLGVALPEVATSRR